MFRNINIDDKKYFENLANNVILGSELIFAKLFAWKDYYQLQIYVEDKIIYLKANNFFFPPITTNSIDFQDSINWIKNYCIKNNFPFSILGITNNELPFLEQIGLCLSKTNNYDYIYRTKSILTYSEKQYHHKRKLVEQFEQLFDYQLLPYEKHFNTKLLKLLKKLSINEDEKNIVLNLIDNLEGLTCFCDCLFINKDLIGFIIGTIDNDAIILFDAVNPIYQGSHSFLIQKTANKHFSNKQFIKHVNTSNEKTRKTLLSYYPISKIEKYQATLDIATQLKLLYTAAFNDTETYKNYFFTQKEKELIYLTNNNIITSTLYYYQQIISIKKTHYPSVLLFALATHPFYQKQGFMKTLLVKAFIELYPNYIFAYLHTDIEAFYEKFSFIKYGAKSTIHKDIKTTEANLETINNIYQEYANKYDVYTNRDSSFWIKFQNELESDSGYLQLLENHRGYIAHDGSQIIEYCDLDNPAIGNDYNMIRIINLKRFIQLYNYKPKTNLKIIDTMIPENNILIMINDGEITNISILDFTKTIFNNLSSLSLEKY